MMKAIVIFVMIVVAVIIALVKHDHDRKRPELLGIKIANDYKDLFIFDRRGLYHENDLQKILNLKASQGHSYFISKGRIVSKFKTNGINGVKGTVLFEKGSDSNLYIYKYLNKYRPIIKSP